MNSNSININEDLSDDVLSKGLEVLLNRQQQEINCSEAIDRKAQYPISIIAIIMGVLPIFLKDRFSVVFWKDLLYGDHKCYGITMLILLLTIMCLVIVMFILYVVIIRGKLKTINCQNKFKVELNKNNSVKFNTFLANSYLLIINKNNEINNKRSRQLTWLFLMMFIFLICCFAFCIIFNSFII